MPLGCSQALPPEYKPPAPVAAEGVKAIRISEKTELVGSTQPVPDRVGRISARVDGHVASVLRDAALPKNYIATQLVVSTSPLLTKLLWYADYFSARLRDADGKPLVEGQCIKKGTQVARLDDSLINEQNKQAEIAFESAKNKVKHLEELRSIQEKDPAGPMLVSQPDLIEAQLVMQDAESKRDALRKQQQFCSLTAPLDGYLGPLQVVLGQNLTAGTVIADVVNLDEIDISCYVPPADAAKLKVGQEAEVIVNKEDGKSAAVVPTGKVVFIAVQASPDTGNLQVKVRFPNPDGLLRTNSVVHVQVLTKIPEQRLCISEKALLEDHDPPEVVIMRDVKTEKNKDKKEEEVGTAYRFRAILGVRDHSMNYVELLRLENCKGKNYDRPKVKSLNDLGIKFVTKGAQGLEDGDKVKIPAED